MSRWPIQAFYLPKSLLESISQEEVEATVADMIELNIYRAPYDEFDIILPDAAMKEFFDIDDDRHHAISEWDWVFRYWVPTKNTKYYMRRGNQMIDPIEHGLFRNMTPREAASLIKRLEEMAENLIDALIVLLATKNVVKDVHESKLAKLGIGKGQRHRYTTTLSVGKVTEYARPHVSTGRELRPHLRRGHTRNQAYGPGLEFHRKIFVEPVFVNADKGWISERTAYNVRKHEHAVPNTGS